MKWVKADGILYKKHCVVVKQVDELPIFMFVEEIFVKDSSLYFIAEICESVSSQIIFMLLYLYPLTIIAFYM